MISPLVGSDRYFDHNEAPIQFQQGYGATIVDQDNNKYTDFILGLGPVILGHADPEFVERMTSALKRGLSFPGFGQVHTELACVFEAEYPMHKVVSLFKTSSEAVTGAMRCAMLDTQRTKIIRCGFLGWHDSQLAYTPSWHEWPGSPKRTESRFKHGMRGVDGSQAVLNWLGDDIESLNQLLQQHGEETAAFAIDVYQLAFLDDALLQQAVAMCRNYDIKIILDETKTAGRTRAGGYINTDELHADYVILGKAIGNGLPLAILLGKPELLPIYKSARIGGTHTKETLSASAAIAVAEIMKSREGYERLPVICRKIVSTINQAIQQSGNQDLVSAVSLLGDTLFDLRFTDVAIGNFPVRELLKKQLIAQGIFMLQGHNSFVCLAHEQLDFDRLQEQLTTALTHWRNAI